MPTYVEQRLVAAIDPDPLVAPALKAFGRIADLWALDSEQRRVILGGDLEASKQEALVRISYILGIYRALQQMVSDPRHADGWIKAPNAAFGGASALDRMVSGQLADLAAVRQYLEAQL